MFLLGVNFIHDLKGLWNSNIHKADSKSVEMEGWLVLDSAWSSQMSLAGRDLYLESLWLELPKHWRRLGQKGQEDKFKNWIHNREQMEILKGADSNWKIDRLEIMDLIWSNIKISLNSSRVETF